MAALSQDTLDVLQRLKDDFCHYAPRVLKIKSKGVSAGSALISMEVNSAQRIIHNALEKQLQERGFVRAIIVKGRQMGSSTYVQARMFWKLSHSKGLRGLILGHTDDSTNNLFQMARVFYENCPPLVRPSRSKSNAKEMVFDKLGTSYKVETAGGRGAGRSETVHFLHLSECAYYPNAETTIVGVSQAVPLAPGTEMILESTSSGPAGLFYEMALAAYSGESDYQLIFIPWFQTEEYRVDPSVSFKLTDDEAIYAEAHGLTEGQMAWRRSKIVELRGAPNFAREYPATVQDAFRTDAPGALWKMAEIAGQRVKTYPPLVRIVVAVDPSGSDRKSSDEQGIIVAGLGEDGNGYVLADGSGKRTPDEWGRKAVDLYHAWEADRIVAEENFGGQMVEATIRTVDPRVSYKRVVASRGKRLRAEPVAALYSQRKIFHVGSFEQLEIEQTTWDPLKAGKSPNRVDALVWAITELMLGGGRGVTSRIMDI